ncbi:hypothetical protein COLO4_09024 [Corchorus olitorius]|uniref:Uncharacterized protein n=1 Tax=Corchorus olitorius TaxID=93759 RepID=A0A1R3KDL4_9ROSI|nr:hypothetical protein COLO4_09024 [Corchorus olitorius]
MPISRREKLNIPKKQITFPMNEARLTKMPLIFLHLPLAKWADDLDNLSPCLVQTLSHHLHHLLRRYFTASGWFSIAVRAQMLQIASPGLSDLEYGLQTLKSCPQPRRSSLLPNQNSPFRSRIRAVR